MRILPNFRLKSPLKECAEHVATEKNEATIELNAAKNKLDVLSNDVEVSKKVVTMLAAEKEDLVRPFQS